MEKIHPQFCLNNHQFKTIDEWILFAKTINKEVSEFLINWFDESKYIALKTSGSTGIPKEIQLKKEYMMNSALATGAYFKLFENTTALLCMSPSFIAGKMMLVRAMVLGWKLDVVEPTSNPLKNSYKSYDFCAMVPLQMSASLNELHKIKILIIGGGAVSSSLKNEIQKLTTQVYATYGMTETVTHIALQKLNNFKNVIASETKQSIYQTLPNIFISVDNRGCLVIEAPLIADKKIITNDLVEVLSPNSFQWLGRIDNVINSGGMKLYPEQIEEKLTAIIKNRFFVAAESDELLGEKVVLVMESERIEDKNLQKLKDKMKVLLSPFEMPKAIYFIPKFIETATKKIQRSKTLDLIFNQPKNY